MTTAPVWWIKDGKASLHMQAAPKNGFDSFSSSDQFSSFNSMVKWSVIASVGVVMTAAVVAIVLAIIDCLKKAGSTSAIYTRLATNIMGNGPKIPSSQDIIAPARTTNYPDFSTELGSGGYGVVFKGEFPGGEQVVVKVLKKNSDTVVQAQFMAEISTMGRTYHVNLVRLYGFCFDPKMTALVYEFMENGSLDTFLFRGNQAIEWQKLQEIAIGTAKGIAYLHEECHQGIIHYDIKPENYRPEARPKMSTVVKMLEGGVEINPPHNPFEHLETALVSVSSKLSDSSTSTTEASTSSSFTPMQGPLDIELNTVTID
ncbi:hypothetical protein RJ639_036424 [Escallonia herrerae]|uniref:Protein kinase domain-containing protein n=1 Tax=Escallonia herrerae TaxID=1293975 RepID=A0AA88WRS4_9ASTE|nr:hypothetical protein RJ639_036424 [Escallonia herrerae]